MEAITMDAKGLVRIPAALRKQLKLEPGSQFRLFVDPNQEHLVLAPTGSIKDGFGILPKPSKSLSIEEMSEAMKTAVAEEVADYARD
jgi:AbrB family looped-hinge helix DNA binding protein